MRPRAFKRPVKTFGGGIARGRTRGRTGAGRPWRSARARCTWTTSGGRARSTMRTAGRRTVRPTLAYASINASRYSGTSSAPCSRRCVPGTPWSAWWWAPTRAAVRGYTPSRARWRRRGRAPSGGGDGRAERASTRRPLGIFVHDVHRRWGSVFWRSWARVIRGRLPAIGRPNADILNHGPPPTYVRARPSGRGWAGGAEPAGPRGCNPASCVGCEPRRACERRAAAASRQVALGAATFRQAMDPAVVRVSAPPPRPSLRGRPIARDSSTNSGMALRLVLAYLAMATAFHVPAQHRFASRPAVHSAPQVLGSRGSSSSG